MTSAELYAAMVADVFSGGRRKSTDPESPQRNITREAVPGGHYILDNPEDNVPSNRSVDLRWAAANTLHFFACTEDAGVLRRYNDNADRFLTGNRLVGAYGPIALPQLHRCIWLLRMSPDTRRAYVSMGPLAEVDLNRPPCWCTLHFLSHAGALDLLVYQRSLAMAVVPYDLVMLTNIHLFVCKETGAPCGKLRWAVGSLHGLDTDLRIHDGKPFSVVFPQSVLKSPQACRLWLQDPDAADAPFGCLLTNGGRT